MSTGRSALKLASGLAGMALPTAAAMIFLTAAAVAGDKPSSTEIEAAVSDKTYQGSMLKDAFVEYYDADGNIRGKGYSGKWRVMDGAMCFQYGDNPENCWDVKMNGPAMTMFKDGKVDGNGILIDGNPNKF